MKKVITTVGTSLFSNLSQNNDYLSKPYSENNPARNDKIISQIKDQISKTAKDISEYSAEIKSLKQYSEDINKKQSNSANEELEVFLITTDTVASNLSATILESIFRDYSAKFKHKIVVKSIKRIDNLNIDNYQKFEKGVDSLIDYISSLLKEFEKEYGINIETGKIKDFNKIRKEIRKSVIFNITGGYKAIIPIMTILAQLYECETLYIFEKSLDKITIPRIPINFDPFLTEALYMDLWMLKNGKIKNPENFDKLKEYGFLSKQIKIKALGKLFMQMVENNQPLAKNVVGYFIEYKILEYLYKTKNYQMIHSYTEKKDSRKDKPELDFVSLEAGRVIEVWEVKPATRLLVENEYKSIKEQIQNQLIEYPTIQEHKLIVYSLNKFSFPTIKANILKLLEELSKDVTSVNFKAEFLHIGSMNIKEQNNNSNPYQPLLKSSIKEEDFIKIQSEDNNE